MDERLKRADICFTSYFINKMITIKGSLTKQLTVTSALSSYSAIYNLNFSKPTIYSMDIFTPLPSNATTIPNWTMGADMWYYKGTPSNNNKVYNIGTDEEKGAIAFYTLHFHNFMFCTNDGFPLNSGTYSISFRCSRRSNETLDLGAKGISIEYSIDNGATFTVLRDITDAEVMATTGDMFHPLSLFTTPTFTLSTYIANFRIRFSNINNITPSTTGAEQNKLFIDHIQIFKR